jgi:hypothetical protein
MRFAYFSANKSDSKTSNRDLFWHFIGRFSKKRCQILTDFELKKKQQQNSNKKIVFNVRNFSSDLLYKAK